MKSIIQFFSILALCLMASAARTTPLYFPALQMTGSTNDVTINIQPVNNPVIFNGSFYWLPPGGTNITTTNGLGYITLIPARYNAYILGLPQSWQVNVTNSATLVNAADLSAGVTYYSGVQTLAGTNGVNVSSTFPGNYLVDGSAVLNASVSNATSGVFPFNLAASTNLPLSGLQGGAGILTNNYAGNVNLNGTNYLGGNVTEGAYTVASGQNAHAEGSITTASGLSAHAEGSQTVASGFSSHAGGYNANATNDNTFVWGDGSAVVGSTTNKQWTSLFLNGYRLLGGSIADNVGTLPPSTNIALKTASSSVNTNVLATTNYVMAATNSLTGTNSPASAFTATSFTGAHYGNGGGLTNLITTNNSALTLNLYAEADAYWVTNSVNNTLARERLRGYEQEKKSFGIWTNFVDAVIEKPGFMGSNNLSFFGRSLTFSNMVITPTNWGAWFNGSNSQIALNGLGGLGLRTNTIVLVMKADATNNVNQYFTGGLVNTNTGSSTFFDSGWTTGANGITYLLYQRAGWVQTNSFAQLIWSVAAGSYSYVASSQNPDRRTVWIISSDGQGNMTCWKDGVPCTIGWPSGVAVYNSNITNTDDLNSLYLGKDLTNAASLYTPYNGQIDVAEIYNCYANSNLVKGIMMSTRWLEPENEDNYFIGDSRTAPMWYTGPQVPYSDWPHFVMKSKPAIFTWQNLAQGGSKWADWNSATTSGTNYLMPAPGFVKRVVYEALGINDAYANGTHGDTLWLYRSNWVANFKASGFTYYPVLLWGVSTNSVAANSYQYNSTNEGYVSTFGSLTLSNAFMVDGVVRADLLNLPSLLSVTNGTSPYSLEGLHFNNTNGYYGNQLIADEAISPARPGGVNQYGVTAVSMPLSAPSLVVTGNITSASGTFTGNGAGLTNLASGGSNNISGVILTNSIVVASGVVVGVAGSELQYRNSLISDSGAQANYATTDADSSFKTGGVGSSNERLHLNNALVSVKTNVVLWGQVTATNGYFIPSNSVVASAITGGGLLWNSNNALYWITSAHTNYVTGP